MVRSLVGLPFWPSRLFTMTRDMAGELQSRSVQITGLWGNSRGNSKEVKPQQKPRSMSIKQE